MELLSQQVDISRFDPKVQAGGRPQAKASPVAVDLTKPHEPVEDPFASDLLAAPHVFQNDHKEYQAGYIRSVLTSVKEDKIWFDTPITMDKWLEEHVINNEVTWQQ